MPPKVSPEAWSVSRQSRSIDLEGAKGGASVRIAGVSMLTVVRKHEQESTRIRFKCLYLLMSLILLIQVCSNAPFSNTMFSAL